MGRPHPKEGGGAEFYRSFLILYPSFLPKEPPVLVEEGSFLPGEGVFHPEERSLLLPSGTVHPKEGTVLPGSGLVLPEEGLVDFTYRSDFSYMHRPNRYWTQDLVDEVPVLVKRPFRV